MYFELIMLIKANVFKELHFVDLDQMLGEILFIYLILSNIIFSTAMRNVRVKSIHTY